MDRPGCGGPAAPLRSCWTPGDGQTERPLSTPRRGPSALPGLRFTVPVNSGLRRDPTVGARGLGSPPSRLSLNVRHTEPRNHPLRAWPCPRLPAWASAASSCPGLAAPCPRACRVQWTLKQTWRRLLLPGALGGVKLRSSLKYRAL